MDFREVQRKVYELYGKKRYGDGLEVIAQARPDHPDHDVTLTFWQACLLGVSGRAEEALAALEEGLTRGLWWAPGMLADHDLDSVRTLPSWDEVEARGEQAAAEVASQRPDPIVRGATSSTPKGTVITLHGAGNDPKTHADRWGRAIPGAWTVVTPAGSVPMSVGTWGWPFDLSHGTLAADLDGLEFSSPAILAGWSQGAGLAAVFAWTGALEVKGLLLLGPGFPHDWDPSTHHRVPTYIVIGEHDFNLGSCAKLRDRMREHGVPVILDERPGLGHEPPNNLEETLAAALDWLSES